MPSLVLPSPPNPPGTVIPYTEYVGRGAAESPRGRMATDECRATRVVEVAWDSLFDFARAAVGYPITKDDGATPLHRWVERRLPMTYQGLQSATGGEGGSYDLLTLYCTDVLEWHGVGEGKIDPATGIARYPKARLTLLFSSLTHEVAPDSVCIPVGGSGSPLEAAGKPDESWKMNRFITRLWRPAQRTDFLPFGAMRTVDASTANQIPIGKGIPHYVPMADLTYIHHALPYDAIPFDAIARVQGKINDAPFDVSYGNFLAGTLLCLSPDIQPYFSPVGTRLFNVVWRFRWQPNHDISGAQRGWNWFYAKVPGSSPAVYDYVEVSSTGTATGTHLCRTADFSTLFRPSQS